MMRRYFVCVSLMLSPGGITTFNTRLTAAEPSGVAGTWRGKSACVTDAPACRSETVVYYIKDVSDRPDVVNIQADKIVDGTAITMGTGPWQYDRAKRTLEWRTSGRVWLLRIDGRRIEGTLKLADNSVFRKVTLEKDQ